MINITLDSVKSDLRLNLIKISIVYPMTRKSHFKLHTNLAVKLTNGETIAIPEGFQFDGSSAPRCIWWLMPSYGDFFFAALVHDLLYHKRYLSKELGDKTAQKIADQEMLIWSNVVNNKNFGKRIDNYLRYYAVRLFGRKFYTT
jgi:hypothetical protein